VTSVERQTWDDYFLQLARMVATRSKDVSTKVGAVLTVGNDLLSMGYNGFPRGIDDDLPSRQSRDVKYRLTVHAEENALLNCARRGGASTLDTTMYITPMFSCVACASAIIQAGVRRVVTSTTIDNPRWQEESDQAKTLFMEAGVIIV
jgi:dCMP deaminase